MELWRHRVEVMCNFTFIDKHGTSAYMQKWVIEMSLVVYVY